MHIPFFESAAPISEAAQLKNEDALNAIRSTTSSSIGYIIKLRGLITSESARGYIGNQLLPFLGIHMPNVHYRVKKCYALIIVAARLVSEV